MALSKDQVNQILSKHYQAQQGGNRGGGGLFGGLGRVFDVISRPLYGVANAADYLVQGKSPIEGIGSGLWGTEKTTFSKVLNDAGVQGPLADIGGFGLDVALDPTTYLGLGTLKNVAREAVTTEGARGVMAAIKAGATKSAGDLAVSAAEHALPGAFDVAGKKLVKVGAGGKFEKIGLSPSTEKSVRTNAISDTLVQARKDAEAAASAGPQNTVALRVGKTQIPIPGGEQIYQGASDLLSKARQNPRFAGVEKAFRPKATYVGDTHQFYRQSFGGAHAEGNRIAMTSADKFKDITHEEQKLITDMIQSGGHFGTKLTQNEVPFQELLDYAKNGPIGFGEDFAKKWGEEATLGLQGKLLKHVENPLSKDLTPQEIENFVPFIYKGGTKAEQDAFDKLRRDTRVFNPETGKWRETKTLQDAADAGLDPERRIGFLLAHQGEKTANTVGSARFVTMVKDAYGIPGTQKIVIPTGEKSASLVGTDASKKLAEMGLVQSKHPFAGDSFFTPEIAKTLESIHKFATDEAAGSELLKFYDKALQGWKFAVTAPNPGHHIRNAIGDLWNNFVGAGVRDPMVYHDSASVLNHWATEPNKFSIDFGGELGKKNAADIYSAFERKGASPGFMQSELDALFKNPNSQSMASRLVGGIRKGSEMREEWGRLGNFIDYLKQNASKIKTSADWEKFTNEAAARTRKYGIDYADLTPFERNFMKRIVPFYTWTRKNIPIQLEALYSHPGRVAGIPKAMQALSGLFGAQPSTGVSLSDGTPEWLKLAMGVPVGDSQQYITPGVLPTMDLQNWISGSPKDIFDQGLQQLSPFIKFPVETGTGTKIGTSQSGYDIGESFLGNFEPPLVKNAQKLAQGEFTRSDLARFFGLPSYETNPKGQKAGGGARGLSKDQITKILSQK